MTKLSLHPGLLLTSTLLLACSGEGSEGSSSETTDPSTSPNTTGSTTNEPTTTGPTINEPTTDTSAMTGTTGTDNTTTTDITTGQTSTTDITGDTSTSDTTSTTDTSWDTSTTGAATDLQLDPASLVFFELPIGSIRHAVGGFDPAQQTCVSIIFFGEIDSEVCDDFQTGDSNGFPYVFITPSAGPPCTEWDYAGNVTLDAASGCVHLTSQDPLKIAIDMTLTVTGAPFTGKITVASP